MSDLHSLLSRGYFPKELPPPFKTVSFGQAVSVAPAAFRDLTNGLPPAKLAHHNLARPGNVYRRLGLPNPAKHLPLCAFVSEHWIDLAAAASKGTLSLSSPTLSVIGRALNPQVLIGQLAEHRTRFRAGKRYILRADIARFYPSIYTHSIPWALHTKPVAKSNKSSALLGNVLDKLVRNSQDGQTVGIPIGPDTSLLIAELVMSAADEALESRVDAVGYRYVDDIELAFSRASEADAALGPLQETLGRFELALNPSKTQVDELPAASEERWISQLRDGRIRKKATLQKLDLIKYFDMAFTLAREFSAKTVLNYAVARLRSMELDDANKVLFQDLLLQSLVNEAGVTRFALEMLIRHRAAGITIDATKLAEAISTVIDHHAPLLHSSEVAWALWAAIVFKIPLDDATVRLAAATGDSVVAILALDAHNRGLVSFDFRGELTVDIGKESFGSDRWLLLYEGTRHGWLAEADVVQSDEFGPFVAKLRDADVGFYDSEVELDKINRPLDQLHGLNMPVLGFVFGY